MTSTQRTSLGVDAATSVEPTTEPDLGPEGVLVGSESEVEPTISVVMPTMNEEAGIGECITRVKNALAAEGLVGEVIVSDDSTDRTPEIAREMGAIVVEPDDEGYGYAYRYAFERARGEYIVMGDADTTYDFEEIPKLLAPVISGEADIVMGSRLDGEIEDGAMPALHQYVGNPLLTKFLNVFYDAGVSDAHSGFRVFHRDVLDELELESTGMEFASEMIMDAGARDLTIAEKPIVYHEREGDATLESFRDGWRHIRFMLLNAPGYLFSVPGTAIASFGVLVMAVAGAQIPLNGVTLGFHSMIAGSLFTLVGCQVAYMGILATVASDPIRSPDDPVTERIVERVRLEHGATVGLVVFGAGAGYTLFLLFEWVQSGFAQVPLLMTDVAALTAIVLGLQTIFSSFCLSAISHEERD